MKEDFTELVEYLDEKFGKVAEDFKELKDNFNLLQNSVDAYAVKADTYFQEMTMLSEKVNRHDKWLLQIAEKLGIKLEY
ncbi:MAG: hypothetical protein A2402_01540 [Candidatus Staskawiczbacteria bacterium RIFOXYC1_FULL_37_43]|nr:MAG: hypothetical protein A2813_00070 [Candidatus Staskawiczbacteria bacterium RIFCSPHIGHO2_01_FULL_37_17]OGZ72130.1 MAG: hypothetical protein A2891_01890 [Candidatus Staskawiczbacteria bacterium RIFCSPLOWO2_01_FULL_37_19]OGZ75501.1 MAG: hypothetical protein A2205_01855 [Candidatus Staskawiczbacteria bacterium RIFOXYA1_FULL_37_15]OGZ77527.1 MAG: hypothetical protein A2280_01840 [Candidatus Staskawiczbacteria bacterium RIFOXYA12_FULL_37_10]OGZ80489.1 MAG: hypothetical protein A2353_03120 [Can